MSSASITYHESAYLFVLLTGREKAKDSSRLTRVKTENDSPRLSVGCVFIKDFLPGDLESYDSGVEGSDVMWKIRALIYP